jgi:radical SAM superfamily enzyme YgiQ (UPF0313 family)
MVRPRVLLIQPPVYDFALFDLFLKPYGLLRIGSWFQQNGYDVTYLNCLDWEDERSLKAYGSVRRDNRGTGKFFRQPALLPSDVPPLARQYSRYGVHPSSVAQSIREAEADIICVTSGMTYWYEGVKEVVDACRFHAPRAKIVLGGVYASLMSEHARRVIAPDALICGDVRNKLPEMLQRWRFPPLISDIPAYPMLIDTAWKRSAGVVRLNTGCPLACDYCASRILDPMFEPGHPLDAFEFIRDLHGRYGTVNFGFYDDALLVNKEKVLIPFLEAACSSGIPWKFYTPNAMHIRYIDPETAQLMHQSGFQEIRLGYESSSPDFHEHHDQKFSDDQFYRAVELLRSSGFDAAQLHVYVLAGLPGQRAEEVLASVESAGRAGVGVSIAEFSPVPGTPAWEQTKDSSHFDLDSQPLFHNNSFQVTAWEKFTRDDMQKVKLAARQTRG